MRLIDADKIIEHLEKVKKESASLVDVAHIIGFQSVIDTQPTAYDVDKVVERLEKLKKQNPFINGIRDNSIEAAASRQTLDYAIDIIKKGGIDEKVNS